MTRLNSYCSVAPVASMIAAAEMMQHSINYLGEDFGRDCVLTAIRGRWATSGHSVVALLIAYGANVSARVLIHAVSNFVSVYKPSLTVRVLLARFLATQDDSERDGNGDMFRTVLNIAQRKAIIAAKYLLHVETKSYEETYIEYGNWYQENMDMTRCFLQSGADRAPRLALVRAFAANALLLLVEVYKCHLKLGLTLIWPDMSWPAVLALPDDLEAEEFDEDDAWPVWEEYHLDWPTLQIHSRLLQALVEQTTSMSENIDEVIRYLHQFRGTSVQPLTLTDLALAVVRDTLVQSGHFELGVTMLSSELDLPYSLRRGVALQDFLEQFAAVRTAFFDFVEN